MALYFELTSMNRGENFCLKEYWRTREPKTPPHDAMVEMKKFDLNGLRNSIVYNMCLQDLPINSKTMNTVLDYLAEDFSYLTQKIYLQVLLHYSKMDVDLMFSYGNTSPAKEKEDKLLKANFYSEELVGFVRRARENTEDSQLIVIQMPEDKRVFLQKALQAQPILAAFRTGLKLLEPNSFSDRDLEIEINNMKMYCIVKFPPLISLRGACLNDGILICHSTLAGEEGLSINKADSITLAAHETAHYLARLQMKNLNFSIPFQVVGNSHEKVRVNPVFPDISLEMGRNMELILFDNIQPDWSKCSTEAAKAFLTRLRTCENLPVIRKIEHECLGFVDRRFPSAPFGIDIDKRNIFFC